MSVNFFKGGAMLKQQYAFLLGKMKIHRVACLTKVMFILFLQETCLEGRKDLIMEQHPARF